MTEAVLAWQAMIFASIGLAGRWRGWAIGLWVVWTIVQVAAVPLSVLQFGTIAVAAAVFGFKTSVKHSPAFELKSQAKPTGVEARPLSVPPTESSIAAFASTIDGWAGKAEAWSDETRRKADERLRAQLQEQQFRLASKQRIKTEGFGCAVEERVMKEALAHDRQLARDIQAELGNDAVLARLYHTALDEGGRLPQAVRERQLAERTALEVARSDRRMLDEIIDNGLEFKRHYLEARKMLSQLNASSLDKDAHLILHDRHLDDWLEEVEALRASRKAPRHSAALSAEALFGCMSASQAVAVPSVDSPNAPMKLAREGKLREPTAYVTRNTFKRVGEGLRPTQLSIDAVFAYIYRSSLRPLLNDTEARRLYVQRSLLQGKPGQLTASEKTFSSGYVFSISPPKFHASAACEYLKADFANYLVPPEIEVQGTERVRQFQQFCEVNKQLLRDKTPEAFWAHVGSRFGISSRPRHVQYANSGIQELASGMDMAELQVHIEGVIAEAEGMMGVVPGGAMIANLRYAPNPKRTVESIEDPETKAIVLKFFELKRNVLDLLFEFYRRESGRDDLALPVILLESAGLTPCRGCWSALAAAQPVGPRQH